MSDSEIETIEKPKRYKTRVASEKQIEHLKKIQPKATEAKKRNKEIAEVVKSYEKAKKPIDELAGLKSDMSKVVQYLSQQEQYKLEKRKQKQAQKEAVDKETSRAYAYNDADLFR
jgi:hypothetical protein